MLLCKDEGEGTERVGGKRETDDIQRRCVGGVSVWYARHPSYDYSYQVQSGVVELGHT